MKIAISAKGPELDSRIDPRFGRAAYFIIVNPETMEFKAINNSQNADAMQGAGIQAAQTVIHEDADVVITGYCGPKAFMALRAASVKVATSEGESETVRSAIEEFKKNKLSYVESPNVAGHWR
ncbi:MAG: NifB/NifX family molybdenum-iron cluster-binding protein [Pseudomonadota bacterium]